MIDLLNQPLHFMTFFPDVAVHCPTDCRKRPDIRLLENGNVSISLVISRVTTLSLTMFHSHTRTCTTTSKLVFTSTVSTFERYHFVTRVMVV